MNPTWLDVAEKELGQHEEANGDNPRIVEYHSTTSLHAITDEVPWCSSFVNWCLLQVGIKGTNSAAAKSWLNWGKVLEVPEIGCICVIHKIQAGQDSATGSSSGFHVAFWLAEEDNRVHLLGGNQSNMVKMSSFNLASYEIVGYRIPIVEGR